ncbi:MAG: hypothetical protein ACFFCZ_17960 [Promethearchaeota archaeon]
MLIKHSIIIKSLLLLCFMFLNATHPIESIASPSSPNLSSNTLTRTIKTSSNNFSRIFYPENNTVIDFTPIPILVRPLYNASPFYNASLMEMRINNGSWSPLIFNTNFVIGLNLSDPLYDRHFSRYFFWYDWFSIDKIDADYTIEFRENSTNIWEEQLRFSSTLSLLPALSLESIQLKYEYEAYGLMSCFPKHTYYFDGTSHSFQIEKDQMTGTSTIFQSACPRMIGQRVLTSTEADNLFTYLTELVYMAPSLNIGLKEYCCDEYHPTWRVTITWLGNTHSLVYGNEHFLPPIFSSFIDFIEELANDTPSNNSLFQIEIVVLAIGVVVIAAVIIFKFWRKKG